MIEESIENRMLKKARRLNSKKLSKTLEIYAGIDLEYLIEEFKEVREERIKVLNAHNQSLYEGGKGFKEEFRALKASEYLIGTVLKNNILIIYFNYKLI